MGHSPQFSRRSVSANARKSSASSVPIRRALSRYFLQALRNRLAIPNGVALDEIIKRRHQKNYGQYWKQIDQRHKKSWLSVVR
jgi:hypothetical protein